MHRYVLALLIVASPFSTFAGELPKEGSYDLTSCWSGVPTRSRSPRPTPHQVGKRRALTAAILPEAMLIRSLFAA